MLLSVAIDMTPAAVKRQWRPIGTADWVVIPVAKASTTGPLRGTTWLNETADLKKRCVFHNYRLGRIF